MVCRWGHDRRGCVGRRGGQYDSATLGELVLGFIFSEKGLIGDLSLEGTKITKIKTTD